VSPLAADLNGDNLPDLVLPDVGTADGQTYDVFALINNTSTTIFTLSVTINGTGAGGVNISPGFHLCGHSCTAGFTTGTVVAVHDTPFSGSTFAGWGGACSGTGSCSLVMDSNKSVTATFNITPDFSLTGSALSPGTVAAGQSATGTVTVNPSGGFNTTVAFSCSAQPSPPYAPTCAVAPTGSGASVTAQTTAPSLAQKFPGSSGWFYAFWLPLVGVVGASIGSVRNNNKKRTTGLLAGAILLSATTIQLACGGGGTHTSGGTPPGNYVITVTGTSGSLQHSTSFSLSVQ